MQPYAPEAFCFSASIAGPSIVIVELPAYLCGPLSTQGAWLVGRRPTMQASTSGGPLGCSEHMV